MRKYILVLFVVLPLIGNSQIKTGVEIGILVSGSQNNKEIIPSSAWGSSFVFGYKIKQFNIMSGIGYSSFQCENKTTIERTDNSGRNLGAKELLGFYNSSYVSVPLSIEYDIIKDKVITPFIGVGAIKNFKVSDSYETNDQIFKKNETIKSQESFTSIIACTGLKAKIGNNFEAIIKSKYQVNMGDVFYSKNETLNFNGIGFNLGLNYLF